MRTLARQGALGLTAGALALVGLTIPAYAAGSGTTAPAGITEWGTSIGLPTDAGSDFVDVQAGGGAGVEYDLALKPDGTVTGWGDGGTPGASLPPNLSNVTRIAAGPAYALALKSDGSIQAWGASASSYATADTFSGVTQLVAGPSGALALKSDGTVAEWGQPPVSTFNPPEGLNNVVQVAATAVGFLALKSDHTVTTWGANQLGELVIPDEIQHHVVAISAGSLSSGVLLDNGQVKILGSLASATPPDGLADLSVDQISVNGSVVVHTTNGEVLDWGDSTTSAVPTSLAGAVVTKVASGPTHDFAIVATLRGTTNPVITGTPQVGQTLKLTAATFNATPNTVSTQWLANGQPIAGATGNNLPLTASLAGKTITVSQTASAGFGDNVQTATATSTAVGPVTTPAPAKTSASIGKLVLKPHKLAKLKKLPLAKLKKAKAVITVTTTGHTATGTVTITLKNKKVTATLTNGKATLKLKKLAKAAKKGTNKLTITYSGDTTTNSATRHTKLKLK